MNDNNKSKEPIIEPFIQYGYGTCPKCGGGLVLADSELTLMELDKNGIPINYDETVIRCRARCVDCGFQQSMIRWEDGYIPNRKRLLMIKKFEVLGRIYDRCKNDLKSNENPFLK